MDETQNIIKKGILLQVAKNPKGKKEKFKNLTTGDIFRFLGEDIDYMVCYNKHGIQGNDILQEINNPLSTRKITDSMMDREVFLYNINSILIY